MLVITNIVIIYTVWQYIIIILPIMKLKNESHLIHINISNSAMSLVNKSNIRLIILFYSQDITTSIINVDSVSAFHHYTV
jgi:hypothetical protein